MPKRRVNLCLNDETWRRLKRHAEQRQISASVAVERAIEHVLADDEAGRQRRMKAVEEIAAMTLGPLGTWDEMEREIEQAHMGELPDA